MSVAGVRVENLVNVITWYFIRFLLLRQMTEH